MIRVPRSNLDSCLQVPESCVMIPITEYQKALKRNSKHPGLYREKAAGESLSGRDAEPVLELWAKRKAFPSQ